MKAKVLSIIIASFYAIQAHAQLGYWYHNSFIELQAIDKSVLFVKNNALKDFNIEFSLKEKLELIRQINDGYIVRTESPEILMGHFVSDIYKAENRDHENTIIVLPRIALQFKKKVDVSSFIESYHNLISLEDIRRGTYIFSCNVSSSDEVLKIASELHNNRLVKWCDPEKIVKAATCNYLYPSQYYLNSTNGIDINVEPAWNIISGDSNIVVAVIDCGVDTNHQDLSNCVLNGYTIDDETGYGAPKNANNINTKHHGISVSGIIAANNNDIGIRGVASGVKILPVNIFPGYATQGNVFEVSDWKIADAIEWSSMRADILNCSWDLGSYSDYVENAINNARHYGREGKGCIVLASSGNGYQSGLTSVTFPAIMDSVIAVGGLDCDGNLCDFSQRGTGLNMVAIGGNADIVTLDRKGALGLCNDDYLFAFFGVEGTSYACAQVSGIVALMLSANPNLTEAEVHNILNKTCRKLPSFSYNSSGWSSEVGYGLVDAEAAVALSCASIVGPIIPNATSPFSVVPLPNNNDYTVSWSWKNTSTIPITQNSPSTNQCTIANSNKAYIKNTLVATISKNNTVITSVEKEIDTGANFYGTYEQEAAVLGVGATVPACPPTAFHSGETIVLSKGSHIILKSPKFVGANISRSGSLSGIWFHQDSIIDVYVSAQLPSGYTNSISSLPFPNSMTFTGTYPNDCEVFRFKLNLTDVIPLLPLSMQVTPSGTGYNITLQRSSPKEIAEADSEDNSLYNISDWNLTIVHSLSGKTVFDNRVAGVQKHVNTAGWLPGVYVVRAQIGDEVVTQKIFVAQ
ncbi:MAG: S8 family serine peptidase [Prevotella sp.]|nr:S8 family serine peptidase [Prevotella sp.]